MSSHSVEDIKHASGRLRGTLLESLANPVTGALADDVCAADICPPASSSDTAVARIAGVIRDLMRETCHSGRRDASTVRGRDGAIPRERSE